MQLVIALKPESAPRIRQAKALAELLSVSPATIYSIWAGRSAKWLDR
jgi:hypothetical protein